MPSEAELSAERIAIVALIAERDGSEFDGEIHLSSEEGERIVAALSAASAVRSEPVAWQWINGAGQLQFATFRPTKGEAPHGYTPLYTSPVQTREDGIREALVMAREWMSCVEAPLCDTTAFKRDRATIDALLSQEKAHG